MYTRDSRNTPPIVWEDMCRHQKIIKWRKFSTTVVSRSQPSAERTISLSFWALAHGGNCSRVEKSVLSQTPVTETRRQKALDTYYKVAGIIAFPNRPSLSLSLSLSPLSLSLSLSYSHFDLFVNKDETWRDLYFYKQVLLPLHSGSIIFVPIVIEYLMCEIDSGMK